jgi:3-dehydroquinate synthase
VESGEQSKSLQVTVDLLKSLTESNADRKSLLLNLGGGVVGDLGGFVASIYMRGIDFIQVPTSLLAMADSSVGGKTGIDFEGLKNQLGTIRQPAGVFIFPGFLNSLSQPQLFSGLSEIIKAGLIADKNLFSKISRLKKLHTASAEEIISRAVEIKNDVVKKDPHEKKLRKVLNFGHTIGHALESEMLKNGAPMLHGEAVALGMLAESYLSLQTKRISSLEFKKIERCILRWYQPVSRHAITSDSLLELMRRDKKNFKQQINFTLLNGIGKAEVNCVVSDSLIVEALSFLWK